MSQLEESQAERENSFLPFYSIHAFNWLVEAHTRWGRHFGLLSLLIQVLVSSKTIPEIMLNQISGSSWPSQIDL